MAEAVPPKVVRRIVSLYCDSGLSTRRISELVHVDRQRVTRILRRSGVEVAARGFGRRRPLRVEGAVSQAVLSYLYVDCRISSVQIGRALGVSDRFVRSRLKIWGIETRTKGQWNREDRRDVDVDDLICLYLEKEWTARDVGKELGVSGAIVLRSAHSEGLPVREGAISDSTHRGDVRLLEALYADSRVLAVLEDHALPVVDSPGPLWARFPKPLTLSASLLRALYVECGLSCFHVELLTGVPMSTVYRRLKELGIERRPHGGRSPFLKRLRDDMSSGRVT